MSVSEHDTDFDSVTDFTQYVLETKTESSSGDSYEATFVSIDSDDLLTNSSVRTETNVDRNGRTSFTQTYTETASYNDDLIINEYWHQELVENYGQEGEFVSSSSTIIYKSDDGSNDDWENDGVADYYVMTKETINQSSGKLLEITWESGERARGSLTVEISKDIDGDQVYDQTRSFSFGFAAPSSWTSMGEHVATLEDTFLVPTESLV